MKITGNSLERGESDENRVLTESRCYGKTSGIRHTSKVGEFYNPFQKNYLKGWGLFEAVLEGYSVSYDYFSERSHLDGETNKRELTFTPEQNVQHASTIFFSPNLPQ